MFCMSVCHLSISSDLYRRQRTRLFVTPRSQKETRSAPPNAPPSYLHCSQQPLLTSYIQFSCVNWQKHTNDRTLVRICVPMLKHLCTPLGLASGSTVE